MQFVKIDATNHTMLAEKYKTTSFPRLFWKRDGAMHRYLGGKKVEDFEAFVQRMNKPAVVTEPPVDQDVYFRLTSKSNGEVSKAFTAVAKAMQDQAKFVQGNGDGEAVVERVQQEGKVQTYKGKPDAKGELVTRHLISCNRVLFLGMVSLPQHIPFNAIQSWRLGCVGIDFPL